MSYFSGDDFHFFFGLPAPFFAAAFFGLPRLATFPTFGDDTAFFGNFAASLRGSAAGADSLSSGAGSAAYCFVNAFFGAALALPNTHLQKILPYEKLVLLKNLIAKIRSFFQILSKQLVQG